MESWMLFSALTALCWATANILDKYVLTNWIKNPKVPVIFTGAIGLAIAGFVFFTRGLPGISSANLIIVLVAGAANLLINVFYFRAAQLAEISRVIPIYYVNPLFIAILAAIFLGEVFNTNTYLGMIFIIGGAFIISSNHMSKPDFGKATYFILLSAAMAAIYAITTKYLFKFMDFWTVFAYSRIGTLFILIPLLYQNFGDLKAFLASRNTKAIGTVILSESLTSVGVVSITVAASIGFVTLVNTLASLQPFFVLLFSFALTRLYPGILNEDTGNSATLQKLVAIVLIFAGVALIV